MTAAEEDGPLLMALGLSSSAEAFDLEVSEEVLRALASGKTEWSEKVEKGVSMFSFLELKKFF